jgi:hypothetical protein
MEPVQTHVGPKADGARMRVDGRVPLMKNLAPGQPTVLGKETRGMGDLDAREHAGECTRDDRM